MVYPKIATGIVFAFLLGVTLGACSQVTDLRKALVENSKPVQSADVFPNAADRGE